MEEAYLGVDIGSISTKGVIIDKNYRILASEYIWTEGDPMGAARKLIELLEKQFDKEKSASFSCNISKRCNQFVLKHIDRLI